MHVVSRLWCAFEVKVLPASQKPAESFVRVSAVFAFAVGAGSSVLSVSSSAVATETSAGLVPIVVASWSSVRKKSHDGRHLHGHPSEAANFPQKRASMGNIMGMWFLKIS